MRKPTFRATPRGRRPGEWQQFTVSVPGRCGTVYTAPRDVFPILHCESSSGQPRGTRTACVHWCWVRVRNGLFLTRNQAYYTRTPSGGTLGACATRQGGVGGGRASSPDRLAARSRGVKRVAAGRLGAGGMAGGGWTPACPRSSHPHTQAEPRTAGREFWSVSQGRAWRVTNRGDIAHTRFAIVKEPGHKYTRATRLLVALA